MRQLRDYWKYARELLARMIMPRTPKNSFDSSNYWKSRYSSGGNSGSGSVGLLAANKSRILSKIITDFNIQSIIDLGCGDGNQLRQFNLKNVDYLGYDISKLVIENLGNEYLNAKNYSFSADFSEVLELNSKLLGPKLVISFDILYHLVQDVTYLDYLEKIAAIDADLILIYSTNYDQGSDKYHVRDRKFTRDFPTYFPNFSLLSLVHAPIHPDTSADFYLFGKNTSGAIIANS